jgi:hypothetical protein
MGTGARCGTAAATLLLLIRTTAVPTIRRHVESLAARD